ncbi:hypothetical protein NLU13_0927 [Sarocladium strictum]|uniref:Protein CAP22 n=1 Tax=Sarocladium strictum TaxID=5046 RepID=A0AA39LBR6_SARSR|nr:hypothetical protein NLU13_0927 [Sarocladium strictum]
MFDIKHLLLLAPLASVAFADLDLSRDDVPPPCRAICQPIVDLTQRCEVDLPGDNNDREEDLLERQCVCTNDSFDVGRIAGLCASCFQQNFRAPDDNDDDDNDTEWDDDDIREIMRDCGFSSASYSVQLSTAAQTVNVVATAPTASSQLTTTINPNNNNNSPQPTNTNGGGSGGNNSNNNDDDNNNSNASQTSDNDRADQTSSSGSPTETGLAVPGAVPLGGFSAAAALAAFGAVAAGGAFLV